MTTKTSESDCSDELRVTSDEQPVGQESGITLRRIRFAWDDIDISEEIHYPLSGIEFFRIPPRDVSSSSGENVKRLAGSERVDDSKIVSPRLEASKRNEPQCAADLPRSTSEGE